MSASTAVLDRPLAEASGKFWSTGQANLSSRASLAVNSRRKRKGLLHTTVRHACSRIFTVDRPSFVDTSTTLPNRRAWQGTAVIADSPLVAVLDQLRSLREGDDDLPRLGKTTEIRVLQFIANTCSTPTTVPSVSPDEEGIAILHWVAGRESLVVKIGEAGPSYLWFKSGKEPARFIVDEWKIPALTRMQVRQFQHRVDARSKLASVD